MGERTAATDPLAALGEVVRGGDAAGVRGLLATHAGLRARLDEPLPGGDFGATALLAAVHRGDREIVDALLAAGADIDQRSHWWAGSFGVLDGDSPLVDYLIERGARVDAYAAARHGWLERLRAILGAEPGQARRRFGDGQTPLHVASTVEVAALLLGHGAEIDALDVDHESTPAQYLVRDHPDVARFLVERGARSDLLMATALGDAALAGRHLDEHPASIEMAVTERWFPRRDPRSGGTIYNWTLGRHWSAHRVAKEFGHGHILALLRERSPYFLRLAVACEAGEAQKVEELLAAPPAGGGGVPEDLRRRLVDAAQDENLGAVRLFLRAGWPVGARGQHGATALHWAAFLGRGDIASALLRHGAPLELRDDDHHGTPLDWALYGSLHGWRCRAGDYGATVAALLAAGAERPQRPENVEASDAALAALRTPPPSPLR